jgi:hypothetical protein
MDSLPLILLSIRTALKIDLKCSAAELVYGTTLRLPGEFFQRSTCEIDPVSLVSSEPQCRSSRQPLRVHKYSVAFTSIQLYLHAPTFSYAMTLSENLCNHHTTGRIVFSLETTSSLPWQDTVSLDRLKPAHFDDVLDTIVATSPEPSATTDPDTPTRTTRSGRRVHFPKRLATFNR